jgi:DNA processing protein
MTPTNELLYQLALPEVPQIGPVQARLLMEYFENAEAVFKAKKSTLEKIEGIGEIRATAIKSFHEFNVFEKEISFIEKYKIEVLFIKDKAYPQKLLHCYDPPTILYYKGAADLNQRKTIAIIGTRNHTEYGKHLTQQLIQDLTPYDPLIISGLAAGIDALAHKQCLYLQIPTVGVLGHGLDTIYPSHHKNLAKEMLSQNGGLLTEFKSGTLPDKHNFPTRNRIVAGMADAVVVIETANKGGSMITARLAFDYNRDVFACPGKTTDAKSEGCNRLIQEQKAQLMFSAKDIIEAMGWDRKPTQLNIQKKIFEELAPNENLIVEAIQQASELHVDQIQIITRLSGSTLAATLLQLELKGIIRQLPGKIFSVT